MIVTDSSGTAVCWNEAAVRLFGWTADDAIGRDIRDLITTAPEDAAIPRWLDAQHLRGDCPTYANLTRKDGSTFLGHVSVIPIHNPDHVVTEFVFSVFDAAVVFAVETELQQTRDRYRALVETLPAATYTLTLDTDLRSSTSMSPQITQITGYPAEWWQADQDFGISITHPDDRHRIRDVFLAHRVTMKPISVEYRYVRPDGSHVWVRNDAVFHNGHRRYWQGFIVDITEQKRAEEALRHSEQEFRSAFVDAAIPMAIAEPSGAIVRVNQPFCSMMGYDENELLGTDISLLTHPDDRSDSTTQRRNVIDGVVRSSRYPRRYLRRDGSIVWGLVNLSATRVFGDQNVYVLGQIQDVTEQFRAEEELRRLTERYQRLIDNANDVIVVCDTLGRFTFVNKKFVELCGYSLDEALTRAMADITHPEDRATVRDMIRRRLDGDPQDRNVTLRVITRAKTTLYMEVNASVIRENGLNVGIQAFLRDVTDRSLAEEGMRRSESRFRRLVEKSTDIVTILDSSGRTMYQSPSSEAILGFAPDEMVGAPHTSVVHPSDTSCVATALQTLSATPAGSIELEYRIRDRSGRVRWIESTARNLLDDPSVAGIVMNSRDATERHRVNQALELQNNFLRLLVDGRPLVEILDAVGAGVEMQIEGAVASVLLADPVDHEPVAHASSRTGQLSTFLAAHDLVLSAVIGTDDRSAHAGVQVSEIRLGCTSDGSCMRQCWSVPIVSTRTRELFGVLAVLFANPRFPEPDEARILSEATSLVHLAIHRHRSDEDRRENESLMRLVLDTLPVGVWFADANGQITMVNSAGESIWGGAKFVGTDRYDEYKGWWNDTGIRLSSDDWGMARAIRRGETSINEEIEIESFDGKRKTILHSSVPTRRPDGRIAGAVVVNHDITDRKELERQLIHQALHDSLTGLPNRTLLRDRLEHALDRAVRNRSPLAVLFFDLDNLKVINDSLGHGQGDALIIGVAQRLSEGLRKGDTLTRLGGDEFIVLVEDVGDVSGAIDVARKIESLLAEPFALAGRLVHVSASIGVALSRPEDSQPEEIIRDADTAMYRAKRNGRAQFAVFDPEMHRDTLRRLEIEQDLRQAIENGGLRLHYQPQFRLATHEISGLEALVRWQHPEKGLIPPDEFIGVAEETGLIVTLGQWVLQEACSQAKYWLDRGLLDDDISIAVNLSARQFRDPAVIEDVIRLLAETELPPRHLTLEMTESAIMDDPRQARLVLNRLHDLGVKLAIDDFGTGYSSLAHLTRFPFDFLKMDRTFVDGLRYQQSESLLIASMVQLGHGMDMMIVGEGIESPEQLECLRRVGCDIVQGFHLSPPIEQDQVTQFLATARQRNGDVSVRSR